MKHEWKKYERELYGVKDKPQIITVPRQNFIMIKGVGNPNMADFSEKVGVLYSLAYSIKMNFKAMCNDEKKRGLYEYSDYVVYPLEGVWTSSNTDNPLDKDCFQYTIMIRQPNYITKEMFEAALEAVKKKKPHTFLSEVFFGEMEDGLSVQMLHNGDYDNEPQSFAEMNRFIDDNNLSRCGDSHREIYLTDANKVERHKLKTVLRYTVSRD